MRSHDECSERIAADALSSGGTGSAVADITRSIHHSEGGGGGGARGRRRGEEGGWGGVHRNNNSHIIAQNFLHMSELKKVTRLKYQRNPPFITCSG